MTKRKDKKAPIKKSALVIEQEDAKSSKANASEVEDVSPKEATLLEQAEVDKNADEVAAEAVEKEAEVVADNGDSTVNAETESSAEEGDDSSEKSSKGKKKDKEKKDDKDEKDDKKSKKDKKDKKERKGIKKRTKETISELKKVVWPKMPEVVKKTGVVLAFVLIFAVVILGLDLLFGFISSALMGNPFVPFK